MGHGVVENRLVRAAGDAAMTIAGLTMLLAPLALWVAPDKVTFKLVLLVCFAACGAVILLARWKAHWPEERGRAAPPLTRLSEQAIERLQNQGITTRLPRGWPQPRPPGSVD